MVHIRCSCGTIFNRKEKTHTNLRSLFRNGTHKGHYEVARWTYGPPASVKGTVDH